MGSPMGQSLQQGQMYEQLHQGQHGGASMVISGAPVGDTGVLDEALRAAARVGPLDSAVAYATAAGQSGGARRKRKGKGKSRSSRKTSRRGSKRTMYRKMRGGDGEAVTVPGAVAMGAAPAANATPAANAAKPTTPAADEASKGILATLSNAVGKAANAVGLGEKKPVDVSGQPIPVAVGGGRFYRNLAKVFASRKGRKGRGRRTMRGGSAPVDAPGLLLPESVSLPTMNKVEWMLASDPTSLAPRA